MSSSAFHNLFDVLPNSKVVSPAPTYQASRKEPPQTLRDVGILPEVELDEIPPKKANDEPSRSGNYTPVQPTPLGAQTPKTPNELEMSRPSTPRRDEAAGLVRTWNGNPMTKWRILCCCLIYFANGMNDSGMLDLGDRRKLHSPHLTSR